MRGRASTAGRGSRSVATTTSIFRSSSGRTVVTSSTASAVPERPLERQPLEHARPSSRPRRRGAARRRTARRPWPRPRRSPGRDRAAGGSPPRRRPRRARAAGRARRRRGPRRRRASPPRRSRTPRTGRGCAPAGRPRAAGVPRIRSTCRSSCVGVQPSGVRPSRDARRDRVGELLLAPVAVHEDAEHREQPVARGQAIHEARPASRCGRHGERLATLGGLRGRDGGGRDVGARIRLALAVARPLRPLDVERHGERDGVPGRPHPERELFRRRWPSTVTPPSRASFTPCDQMPGRHALRIASSTAVMSGAGIALRRSLASAAQAQITLACRTRRLRRASGSRGWRPRRTSARRSRIRRACRPSPRGQSSCWSTTP